MPGLRQRRFSLNRDGYGANQPIGPGGGLCQQWKYITSFNLSNRAIQRMSGSSPRVEDGPQPKGCSRCLAVLNAGFATLSAVAASEIVDQGGRIGRRHPPVSGKSKRQLLPLLVWSRASLPRPVMTRGRRDGLPRACLACRQAGSWQSVRTITVGDREKPSVRPTHGCTIPVTARQRLSDTGHVNGHGTKIGSASLPRTDR